MKFCVQIYRSPWNIFKVVNFATKNVVQKHYMCLDIVRYNMDFITLRDSQFFKYIKSQIWLLYFHS